MKKNKSTQKNVTKPVENHQSASWANITSLTSESNVPIPSNIEVENSKRWVDTNEK